MSTKWKYATIPAEQRIEMLQNGNDELYKEELSRTQDAIVSRLEAGLDVSEQMKWADTVSYNHNLSKAKNMGIPEENVQKSGYADKLFGNLSVSTKSGTSTVKNPTKVVDSATPPQTLEEKLKNSYIRGINERISVINSSYNDFANKINTEYDKKKKAVIDEYNHQEKIYAEKSLNDGYSQYGGRSLTDKLKSRENLVNLLASLDEEKMQILTDARNSLNKEISDVHLYATQAISDEYYKYSKLLSENNALEYQKIRDKLDDDVRWQEFLHSKSIDEAEILLAKQKLDQEKAQNDRDYEAELKQFEADNAYRLEKLKSDQAIEYAKLNQSAKNSQKNQDTENTGTTESTVADYEHKYENYLNLAKKIKSTIEQTGKSYKFKYTDEELYKWIQDFDLTDEEKEKICIAIGIKFK